MLKLIVCIIIFAANCCAHQFLTCSISDSVLSQQSPQTSQQPLLGSPGARGPKGQMGSRGNPGQKGEPGIQDNRQINLLRNQFNTLSQEVAALNNRSNENQQKQINALSQEVKVLKNRTTENQLQMQINYLFQEVEALKNQTRKYQQQKQTNSFFLEGKTVRNQSRGNLSITEASNVLHVSSYVYIYRLTPGSQSWQKSREICQSWGGDLAMHGIKILKNREKLIKNMSMSYYFWIGVNDIASEGNWVWVNGERAFRSEVLWESGYGYYTPDSDCAIVNGYPKSSSIGKAFTDPCDDSYKGLCEKEI